MTPAARAALARMHPIDVAALAACLAPAPRVELRDAIIRTALARFYPDATRTGGAKALAAALAGNTPPGTLRGDMIAAIIALNDGAPLGWRQLATIAG